MLGGWFLFFPYQTIDCKKSNFGEKNVFSQNEYNLSSFADFFFFLGPTNLLS